MWLGRTMTFLKKSTSKLKVLSRKALNGQAVDEARAASEASAAMRAKPQSKHTPEILQEAWKKLEQEAPKPEQNSLSPSMSADSDLAQETDMTFVAETLKSYQAPEFKASLGQPDNHIDVTPNETPPRAQNEDAFDVGVNPVLPRPARADVSAMRLDVARISADIQSGEELYRRAQQRIENLTSFVERADIDFSLLNRLEPENRRLKARNRTLEAEIDDKQRKLSIMQIDLEDHRKRLEERNAGFEQAQSKLSVAKKSLQTYERTLSDVQQKLDKSDLSQERIQTALEIERRENEVLRERVTVLSTDLDEKHNYYLEAKKMADSLVQDCNDFRHASETTHKANIDLRNALDAAQKQNNAMKGEMISLHEDIRSFKTQYEFNVISREDEITAMQNQIATLKKQLEIKDEIVRNAARDVTDLRKIRTAQDLERERLEAQIEAQTFQLEEVNSELAQSRQDVSDFDRRYRDVATALSVTQARRASNAPAQAPDIQPRANLPLEPAPAAQAQDTHALAAAPQTPAAHIPSQPIDEYDDLTDDDIINRITEFKLGLRENIG